MGLFPHIDVQHNAEHSDVMKTCVKNLCGFNYMAQWTSRYLCVSTPNTQFYTQKDKCTNTRMRHIQHVPKYLYICVSLHKIQSPNTVCGRNVSTFLYFTFLYFDLSQNSFAMDFRLHPARHDSVASAPARVGMYMYISLCMTC